MGEIVSYLKDAQAQNNHVGREELLGNKFVPPLNAGLVCLAASPSQVYFLVPEPYRCLSVNDTVKEIYESCVDYKSNVFNLDLFQRLCNDRINALNLVKMNKNGEDNNRS